MIPEGTVAVVLAGKYRGRRVVVENFHNHVPTLYTCEVFDDGALIAVYEDELEETETKTLRGSDGGGDE